MTFICTNCESIFKTAGTFAKHINICDWSKIDIYNIRQLYNDGCTITDIKKKYSIKAITFALRGYRMSQSKRQRTIKKKNKNAYKWSIKTRQCWSRRCKQLHAQHRMSSWFKQGTSYAERTFFKFLVQSGFKHNDDFFTEVPFDIFRVDFFFPKMLLAIEIDGKQHYRYKRRIDMDKRKDNLLVSNGIDVLRVRWQVIHHKSKEKFQQIKDILNSQNRKILISQYMNDQLLNFVVVAQLA